MRENYLPELFNSINKICGSGVINHFKLVDALIIGACLGLWRLMGILMAEQLKKVPDKNEELSCSC